jgi:NAD(P)-dependent dehydrogenase (short-subunit alcohol dehydrogenase family)
MVALTEAMSGGSPAYRIPKDGLNGLTVYLQGGYGDQGLIANAASPGWVSTDMSGPEAPRDPVEGADTPIQLASRPEAPAVGSGATERVSTGKRSSPQWEPYRLAVLGLRCPVPGLVSEG